MLPSLATPRCRTQQRQGNPEGKHKRKTDGQLVDASSEHPARNGLHLATPSSSACAKPGASSAPAK
eukprot:11218407-Lingulodinium_polyedra.AAC.1